MQKPILLIILLLNLFLFQKFTIIGNVRDTKGRSVPNIRISVMDENFQPIRTIFVDSSGQFFVTGLSPGRYQFKVETTGTSYQEQDTGWIELQSLRLRAGGTENYPLDITLKLKPNAEAFSSMGNIFVQGVPQSARLEYRRGVKLIQERKSQMGVAAFTKAIEIFPDYFDALENLGVELVKSRDFSSATLFLQRAISINPRAAKSFYSLGVAYLKINQFKEAIQNLNRAAEFEAANANTPMMLGLAYGHNHQLGEAETAFHKALKLGGTAIPEAHFYLAAIYEKQKKYNAAVKELEVFIQEAKDINDRSQLRKALDKLKEKAKNEK